MPVIIISDNYRSPDDIIKDPTMMLSNALDIFDISCSMYGKGINIA